MKEAFLKFIKQHKIYILVVALLTVLAILPLIFVLVRTKSQKTEEEPKMEAERKIEQASQLIGKDFSLKIGPQIAGISLSLEEVSLPKTSWLVIHAAQNNKPGEVLEEAIPPLNPGVYDKYVVILRTPLKVATYYASLHIDDGDLKFDPQKDPLAKNQKGQDLIQGFIVR